MKSRFLFPKSFQAIGLLLAIPGFILGYFNVHQNFEFRILDFQIHFRDILQATSGPQSQNFTNELALTLVITGLVFIAFSKLRQEDELTARLRLDALYWAVLINYVVYFLAKAIFWFSTAGDFKSFCCSVDYGIAVYTMFTPLIIFILRFKYLIHYKKESYLISQLHYLPYFPFRFIGKWISIACISLIILNWLGINDLEEVIEWVAPAGVILPISLLMWAYSEDVADDELITQFRLESMQLSIYVNYGLLILANLTVFGFNFLYVMAVNLISPLLFFVLRFSYVCNKNYWQVRRDVRGGLLS